MKNINNEHYALSDGKKCEELLAKYPDYKVFWRSGFTYRGAREREIKRYGLRNVHLPGRIIRMTFEREMKRHFIWSAAIDIDVDHEKKELHFNGFSENDMY